MPEWLKGRDCKSLGSRLRWFETTPHNHFMTPVLSMHGRATISPESGALVRKKAFLKLIGVINIFMVAVAQVAEHWIVVPGVAGSTPVGHPNF